MAYDEELADCIRALRGSGPAGLVGDNDDDVDAPFVGRPRRRLREILPQK